MTENNLIPRGTDRVRRLAQQEQAKVLSEQEIAKLTSPSTPEKAAAIAAAQPKPAPAPQSIRKAAQARHAAEADAEAAIVASSPMSTGPLAGFRPGQQVDHITARNFQKRFGRPAREQAMTAAKAAGKAVLNVLQGREQPVGKPSRFRKRAKHAAAQAAAKKQG